VAQLVLYAFWLFFAGLVYYLVRENHREGYPMDSDRGVITGWPVPEPKIFKLAGGEERSAPNDKVSPQTLNAQPMHGWTGAPLEPEGNPLLAGVGPGSWADRADEPDTGFDGHPNIVPLRNLAEYGVSEKDPDPRGQQVFGGDGEVAGIVTDLWLDTSEAMFRYLEVRVQSNGRQVLLPIPFARITRKGEVKVHAIHAHQFGEVPGTKQPDLVTMLEEEKIMAYYGAGLLYADPSRSEPLI
jgi:photosynthetic reaction center H subunit